jgi:dihydrodipicolinate synthase/N-acetylneuraminate lyase
MGLTSSAELRLPLVELAPEHTEKLQQEMKKVGLL